MNDTMNVHQWVELFQAIGLDEATMQKWHQLFESRYPDQHHAFLAWLRLPPEEIQRVRSQAQGG